MLTFHINALRYKEKLVLTFSNYIGTEYLIDTSWLLTIEKYEYLLSYTDLIVIGLTSRHSFDCTCKIFVSGLLK